MINYRIITDDGPVLASTVTYLLPVVAVILGAVVLAEPITVQLAAGVAIVLAGVALTRRKRVTVGSRTTRPALLNPALNDQGPAQAPAGGACPRFAPGRATQIPEGVSAQMISLPP